ncbi:septum formation family protein [Streptomyces sp. APSN-46.1]|uniref:DUF4190 domain-containing protein n=1 Tax=Streptomyces sp. APSN-46.1 TaxID=2929049 RepID=UPI001FB53F13|nr:DUF4190 domain-containing protein [Streptomyces sp. APSN-46.1]MCJ1680118.1 septum formation family protein [Streptomyces sp. APSN-46.1]
MSRLPQPLPPPSSPEPHPQPGPYGQPGQPRSHGGPQGRYAVVALVLSMLRALRRVPLILGNTARLPVRHRGQKSKGVAVAPAAVHSTALVFVLFLGLSGVADDGSSTLSKRDTGGRVTGPVVTDVEDIKVGDCFNTDDDLKDYQGEDGRAPLSVDIVPCAEPHQSEAFAVFGLKDGPYPGEKKIASMANANCGKALTDYVGAAAKLPKTMKVYYYYPSSANWTFGEREVTCFIGDTSGPSTGSVRATSS